MPAPTAGAVLNAVAAHLTLTTDTEKRELDGPVGAVLALMSRWHDLSVTPDDADDTAPAVEDWPADLYRGAVMLAARLYRRKNSPDATIAAEGEFGPMYVTRNDPDIAMLLRFGRWGEAWIV